MKWIRTEVGWYHLVDECIPRNVHAAVCQELIDNKYVWCTYVTEDMPPGDSQHRTLAEAKAAAEQMAKVEER